MIQKLILIFIFLIPATVQWGQSAEYRLDGRVLNDAGEQLPGASVFINDSIHIIANAQGEFSYLYKGKLPVAIVARYVGCFPRRIVLTSSDLRGRVALIDLVLNIDGNQLNEVQIDAARVKQLAEEDFTTEIFDFEFADGKLLLLLRVKKKYYLRLATESGTQLDQIQLDYPAQRFFRSCLNNLHVVGDHCAQEITLKSKTALDTMPRYSKLQFTQVLEPCVAENEGIYYYKRNGFMNQSVEYNYIGKDGLWNQLANISNNAGIAEAQKALDDFFAGKSMMGKRPWGESTIDEGMGHIDIENKDFSLNQLLKKAQTSSQIARLGDIERIKTDSVYAPLMKSDDTLFLFDHVNGKLIQLKDPASESWSVPISYQMDKGWQTELFYDRQTHRFYAIFWFKGKYLLKMIDTSTGKADVLYPLEEMPLWSKKIKIYNGYLYYLGQEDPNVPNYTLKKVDFQRRTAQN